jgi:glycosyltransferase involved in cell wall biosynthesis
MKILHVCYSDIEGGAARAAFRLHSAQIKDGIDSHMLVVDKFSDDIKVHSVPKLKQKLIKLSSGLSQRLLKLQKGDNTTHHSLNFLPSFLLSEISKYRPDVVNLHWIGNEMLSIGELSKIPHPLIWTFHDMWGICGAEHYESLSNPGRYLDYEQHSRAFGSSGVDIDKWLANKKLKKWKSKKMMIVSPSHWLDACVKKSKIMGHANTVTIQNCLDHSVFKKTDRNIAREILSLPKDKKIILFGAMSSTSDPRKGFHYLKDALKLLKSPSDEDNIEVVVFGASHGDVDFELPIRYLGRVHDDVTLALIYSAADVFVGPSLQDNLPNTFVEAIACGLPCVGFNIGGIKDIISDNRLGILVDELDPALLSGAIKEALSRNWDRNQISSLSRAFRSEESVVAKYKAVYQGLVND